jgi:microcystin-dependent protein
LRFMSCFSRLYYHGQHVIERNVNDIYFLSLIFFRRLRAARKACTTNRIKQSTARGTAMTDEKIIQELERLKAEVDRLSARRPGFWKRTFSKTSVLIGIALTFVVSSLIVYAATISKPYNFTDGTIISAGEVNADFNTLYSEANSKETRLTALEAHDHGKLQLRYIISYNGQFPGRDEGGAGYMEDQFIGEIRLFAGSYAPQGWMFCEGQILQINDHMALYAIIGCMYGGNCTSNFALPDLRGKVPVNF